MKNRVLTSALLCAIFTTAQIANAQVAEVRIGLTEFDERSLNVVGSKKNAFGRGNENSVGINAEVLFEEPEFLKWALTPQPYVNGTLNLGGKTSFAGGGLLWRQNIGKKFYADVAFGGVIHNGETDIGLSGELTPENIEQQFSELYHSRRTQIEFGSRLLFREQFTLGVRLDETWAGEVFFEHLSNAGLSESGTNEGVDNIGVKVARRF